MDKTGGVWRTVRGRRVFIRDGETATEAINRSLGKGSALPEAKRITPEEMVDRLKAAKESSDPKTAWRVDDTYTAEDYRHYNCECLAVGNKSCVAVKHGGEDDGDIISVCRSNDDIGVVSGKQLLEIARQHGGTKLDSFEGNHVFYEKCGFEPVSWVRFDREYAPHDWNPSRDGDEVVIFYRYTGEVATETTDDFCARVPASEDYDAAKVERNARMAKGG